MVSVICVYICIFVDFIQANKEVQKDSDPPVKYKSVHKHSKIE
jgi:hypothetical protein